MPHRKGNTQMITWTTEKGNKVEMMISTTEPNLADSTITNGCYKLDVLGNGKSLFMGGFDLKEVDGFGIALKGWFGGSPVVSVPADKVSAVQSMIADFSAEISRRVAAEAAADAEYQRRHDAVERLSRTGR